MTAELEDMKQAGSNKVIFLGVDQEWIVFKSKTNRFR